MLGTKVFVFFSLGCAGSLPGTWDLLMSGGCTIAGSCGMGSGLEDVVDQHFCAEEEESPRIAFWIFAREFPADLWVFGSELLMGMEHWDGEKTGGGLVET